MHEASLAQGLLELVLNALEDHGAGKKQLKVKEIVCGAGLLAGFENVALRLCFEMFAEGTPCEGAALVVNDLPLDCVCRKCGSSFQLTRRRFQCPDCGGDEIDFSGGHGLILQAINVESEDELNHD